MVSQPELSGRTITGIADRRSKRETVRHCRRKNTRKNWRILEDQRSATALERTIQRALSTGSADAFG
jgi:hypothetical protein